MDPRLTRAANYREFADEFAGASFGGGIYRVHDGDSGPLSAALITEAFPDFPNRLCPFGYDWLGRQFALDTKRLDGGEPMVMLVDVGAGEALEVPRTFADFHEEELLEFTDEVLASNLHAEWADSHSSPPTLSRSECVGYEVPLFLGGADDLSNLAVTDLEVYWTLSGQLRRGVMNLPT